MSIARTAGVAASEVHPVLVSLRSKGFLEESEGRWRLAAQSQDDNDNL